MLKLAQRPLGVVPRMLTGLVSTKSYSTEVKPEQYGIFPDPVEHATGLEKKAMIARLAGDDRYESKVYRRGPGTKDQPNLVPSHFESRLMGCICEPNQLHINYLWIKKGNPARCDCGYWFKAIDADPDSH